MNTSNKVVIAIRQGCADVISQPPTIFVEVRDYDVQEDDECYKHDQDGDVYRETIFEPKQVSLQDAVRNALAVVDEHIGGGAQTEMCARAELREILQSTSQACNP